MSSSKIQTHETAYYSLSEIQDFRPLWPIKWRLIIDIDQRGNEKIVIEVKNIQYSKSKRNVLVFNLEIWDVI